jgi:hypothetical protein
MYCSIEEAWPTYNYTNNPISRSNGVENFLNDEVNEHSIMNKNDIRPQFQTNIQTNNMRHNTSLPIKENSHNQYGQYNAELMKIKNHLSHENHFLHNRHNKFCSCQDFMYHLQNCEECQNLMHSKFKPSKIEEILLLNPNIKETIVIFLVGILILMILNLFYK